MNEPNHYLQALRDWRDDVLIGDGPMHLNFSTAVDIASMGCPPDPDRARKVADALDEMVKAGELRRVPEHDSLATMHEVLP